MGKGENCLQETLLPLFILGGLKEWIRPAWGSIQASLFLPDAHFCQYKYPAPLMSLSPLNAIGDISRAPTSMIPEERQVFLKVLVSISQSGEDEFSDVAP